MRNIEQEPLPNKPLSPQRSPEEVEKLKNEIVENRNRIRKFIQSRLSKKEPNSKEVAEDLTQDTIIRSLEKIHQLENEDILLSWMTRIAINNINQYYRNRRMPKHGAPDITHSLSEEIENKGGEMVPLKSVLNNREGEDEFIEKIELSQKEEAISKIVSELPFKRRAAFVLRYIENLSYQEIAEILNLSMAAVKSHIHRAKVEIREKLKKSSQN